MSNETLAKKLRELAMEIEGKEEKKIPKMNSLKTVPKDSKKSKSESKLIALMNGEPNKICDCKIVLASLKIRNKRDIPFSDIKNILIKVFKFRPAEFAGITKCSEGGSYSFLAYESAVKRCLKSDVIEQGCVLSWAPEDLCKHVALAATICNKIIMNSPSNKSFKKVASFYLNSFDGDIPCIMDDIIMSVNSQNE